MMHAGDRVFGDLNVATEFAERLEHSRRRQPCHNHDGHAHSATDGQLHLSQRLTL